jgi:dTDP-4-amino-4,6-dideoxygalactose transaminase
LDEIDLITNQRKDICKIYQQALRDLVTFQSWNKNSQNNYAYAPVLFKSEEELLRVKEALDLKSIFARRYFYPSLDTLKYLQSKQILTNSRYISKRILCLPLYSGLAVEEQEVIVNTIIKNV